MTENTTASGAAYDLIDRYLRNNLDDADYAEYSTALEVVLAASAPVAPTMVDMVPPATSRDRWMYEQGRLAERDPRTSRAAPAPQPAVPEGYVLVPVDPTPEMVRAAYSGPIQGGLEAVYANMIAAAPKAAPAINKVSDIIDAYGMTPGQPERVADIPGLAEALEAAFADGSAQVTGAAQAAPAEDDKWRSLALQFDSHRMQALSHLKLLLECGEDHADAVRTFLAGPPLDGESVLAQRIAAYAQPAPVAEDAEIRKALHDAATSLETINRIADQYMQGMMDVRLYAAARAKVAREALAAQPEGGAK